MPRCPFFFHNLNMIQNPSDSAFPGSRYGRRPRKKISPLKAALSGTVCLHAGARETDGSFFSALFRPGHMRPDSGRTVLSRMGGGTTPRGVFPRNTGPCFLFTGRRPWHGLRDDFEIAAFETFRRSVFTEGGSTCRHGRRSSLSARNPIFVPFLQGGRSAVRALYGRIFQDARKTCFSAEKVLPRSTFSLHGEGKNCSITDIPSIILNCCRKGPLCRLSETLSENRKNAVAPSTEYIP